MIQGDCSEWRRSGRLPFTALISFRGIGIIRALTESAFVGIPDSDGRRTFRTGDLGRLQRDGCLEYLGRKDFRLKIRGHRIQAEEVESALLRVPGNKPGGGGGAQRCFRR